MKNMIEIGYSTMRDKNVISYINFDMLFNLKAGKTEDVVKTNMKLINFDYEKSFTLPLHPKIDFKHDYEKVSVYPYNAALFENYQFIKEGEDERKVRKLFDSIRCYNSVTLDESLLFLQKRFQRWNEDWQLDDDVISSSFLPEAHVHYGNNYSKSKRAAWDSAFAYCFIFLDRDCFEDTVAFTSGALLDYTYSYLLNKTDPVYRAYMKLHLNSCKQVSDDLLKHLIQKYKSTCPTEDEFIADYKKFSDINVNNSYLIHTKNNSPDKEKEYSILEKKLLKK